MSGDDSSLSLRAPARETVFRPFPSASPSGALYIERMFFLRPCIEVVSINQFTVFISIVPYIPTVPLGDGWHCHLLEYRDR